LDWKLTSKEQVKRQVKTLKKTRRKRVLLDSMVPSMAL